VIAGLERAGGSSPHLDELRRAAERARDAVDAADFVALGLAMIANTDAQARLHPDLVGTEARTAIDAARANGALGWKVNGAGGDGLPGLREVGEQRARLRRAVGIGAPARASADREREDDDAGPDRPKHGGTVSSRIPKPGMRTEHPGDGDGRAATLAASQVNGPPSSSGLGRRPFTAVTGIRTPLGVQTELRPELRIHSGPVVQFGVHAALSRR